MILFELHVTVDCSVKSLVVNADAGLTSLA
jgi:hypothetical protein